MSIVVLSLFVFLLIGMPIAAAFALAVFLNADSVGVWLHALSNIPFESASRFALAAIPLFILVGELMSQGGLAKSLTAALDLIIGRLRAAFGYVMIGASAFMGAITGSSVATVAAIGAVVGPEMKARGYPGGYVAALNAAAGLLGVLIPPSIPLILYGAAVGVSITQLFLATLLPGLVMVCAFALVHMMMSRRVLAHGRERSPEGDGVAVEAGTQWQIARRSVPAVLLPVFVLGGIYGGFLTPTEAAAAACLYAILVIALQRRLGARGLVASFYRAAIPSAAILIIIAMTGVLNRVLVLNQVPQDLAAFITGAIGDPVLFLLAVNLLLFVVGMFMETNAAVLLMGPLLAPSAAAFGIDPVHFAIIVVTNIEIGLLTPPLAANLYVAARTNDVRLTEMLRYFLPFLGAAVCVLLLVTFVPEIALWYRLI